MAEINPGDIVTIRTNPPFSNAAGDPADPAEVRFLWRRRGAPPKTLTYGTDDAVVRDGVGVYHVAIEIEKAGTHYVRWEGEGGVTAAEETSFEVVTKFG